MKETKETTRLNLGSSADATTQPIAKVTLYDTMLEEASRYMELIAAGRESEVEHYNDIDELVGMMELFINGQGGESHLIDRNWSKKDELWYTWSVEAAQCWRVLEPLLMATNRRLEPARLTVTRKGKTSELIVDLKSINDKGQLVGLCRPQIDGGTLGVMKFDTLAAMKQRQAVLTATNLINNTIKEA